MRILKEYERFELDAGKVTYKTQIHITQRHTQGQTQSSFVYYSAFDNIFSPSDVP